MSFKPAVICLLFQVSAILMDILCPICEIHVWVQQESAQNNSNSIERVLLTGAEMRKPKYQGMKNGEIQLGSKLKLK